VDNIIAYLGGAFDQNFVQGEYNHVVQGVYKILVGAARFEADTLEITRTHIVFWKDGVPIKRLNIASFEQPGAELTPSQRRRWTSHRKAMHIILKHDAGVREYAKLISETHEAVVYHLSVKSEESQKSGCVL
jgi:hypothetical protein